MRIWILLITGLMLLFAAGAICAEMALPAEWQREASRWPVARLTAVPAPDDAQARFSSWLQRTLADAWQPGKDETLAYYPDWGFIYVKNSPAGHLRVREAMRPVYDGAQVMTDGLVMTVTPAQGAFTLPRTRAEMVDLLGQFLAEALLDWPEDPQYQQPRFTLDGKTAWYLQPNCLTAWTDGTALHVVYYQTPAYTAPEDDLARSVKPGTYRPAHDGSLNYPLGRALQNPWLVPAAAQWPATNARSTKTAGEERDFFSRAVQSTVAPTWWPNAFADVRSLKGLGPVYTIANATYRVRVRQTALGMPRPVAAVLIAVEPLGAPFPLPQDPKAMLALLKPFVAGEVLAMPAREQCPPELRPLAGGVHFARYRTESPSATVPVDLFAWTDGNILLIALPQNVTGDCPTCTF